MSLSRLPMYIPELIKPTSSTIWLIALQKFKNFSSLLGSLWSDIYHWNAWEQNLQPWWVFPYYISTSWPLRKCELPLCSNDQIIDRLMVLLVVSLYYFTMARMEYAWMRLKRARSLTVWDICHSWTGRDTLKVASSRSCCERDWPAAKIRWVLKY